MSATPMLDLYELLPALYRIRDAEQGYPLRALLDIIARQADVIKGNIDALWDDLFIETCAPWVIPYIGDLVGNRPLYEVAARRRADVARTIHYRRRKGTLPMLEALARGVTGWGAHAVACFELLGWTQHLNHLRLLSSVDPRRRNPSAVDRVGTVNLRDLDLLDRLDGPFDALTHTVEVRPMGRNEGWHGPRKVAFFLWRLRQYTLAGVTARQSATHAHGYHFSPLGNPAPLFTKPRPLPEEPGLAEEIHVPGPIRPLALHRDLERCRRQFLQGATVPSDYYGNDLSLLVIKDGTALPAHAIVCQDLSDWARPPAAVTYQDPDGTAHEVSIEAGVDVHLGRLSFPEGKEPEVGVVVAYSYGFSADLGGGPYDRSRDLIEPGAATWSASVSGRGSGGFTTLAKAVTAWSQRTDAEKAHAVITIADNSSYEESITLQLGENQRLTIQAAKSCRPVVIGNVMVEPSHPTAGLTLHGLLIAGSVAANGDLSELRITHCTLVPGRALTEEGMPSDPTCVSLSAAPPSDHLRVEIERSIVGPVRLPVTAVELIVRDSIIDSPDENTPALASPTAGEPGPSTTMERTTVFGAVQVKELVLASEAVFTGLVTVSRRQSGCVRFSYLPPGSQAPRRYRCQPELAVAQRATELGLDSPEQLSGREVAATQARVQPAFTSRHYGHPAYAQLRASCAVEIRTGAEDGSEMGAFSHLKQPQREANLRLRLEEYLPFGLDAGLIAVT